MRSRSGRRRSPSPATPGRYRPLPSRPGREGARADLRRLLSSRQGAGQQPAVPRVVRIGSAHGPCQCREKAGFIPAVPKRADSIVGGKAKPFRKSPQREDEQPGWRKPAGQLLSQVDLVELLDPARGPPATHQGGRAARLAYMREPGLDFLGQHISHVDLERGLDAAEAPGLRGLMRRTGLRKCERIASAGPRGVECDATDDTVIRMKAVRNVGVECEENIRLRRANLAHELLAQLQALNQLGIGMAEKLDALDAQHLSGHFLLTFANARNLRA